MKMDSGKWTKEFEDNPTNTTEHWQSNAGDDNHTKIRNGENRTTEAPQLRRVA
jgi:hypothetical protein